MSKSATRRLNHLLTLDCCSKLQIACGNNYSRRSTTLSVGVETLSFTTFQVFAFLLGNSKWSNGMNPCPNQIDGIQPGSEKFAVQSGILLTKIIYRLKKRNNPSIKL